jgi:AcrR family transcriptional regulator
MQAAVDHLLSEGVLGGLNLREIADRVGVTPANVYHYFGSRRGLLRAALTRESARLLEPLKTISALPFVQRRLQMFDYVTATPELKLGALLALDDDPDFEPLPFVAETSEQYRAQVEAGLIPDDVDVVAVHLMTLAASIGVAIYRDAVARQLEVDADEITARVRGVLARMLESVTTS